MGKQWPRDTYTAAVWSSLHLRPNEKLVALVYAKYARDRDTSWVLWRVLSEQTGIRSKDAVNRAIRGLEKAGWLALVEKPRQHRSAVYRLVVPTNPEVRHTYCWGSDDT